MMNMVGVDKVVSLHAQIIPSYLFLQVQRVKSMDIVINGRIKMYLVIQVKGKLVIWSLQEEI